MFLLKGGLGLPLPDPLTKGFGRLHHPGQLIVVPHIGFPLSPVLGDG